MSKSPKKNKGFQTKNQKTQTVIQPVIEQSISQLETENSKRKLEKKTLFGVIQTDLYETLLKPAISSFSLRRDDEPLRQLVESIVTAIAMNDAYEDYRKIDDIFQRYLYYLESIDGSANNTRESIELSTLCDYWRTQVFITLFRNSSAIFGLLLPDSQPQHPSACTLNQNDFLHSIRAILNNHLDPTVPISRESTYSRELYDFAYGISFPWLGFPAESVFGIQAVMPNEIIEVEHEFALASAEQIQNFDKDAQKALFSTLFIDLIFAQHHKVYAELEMAFHPEDPLPDELKDQLSQRIRFDKTYQSALDSVLAGATLTKQLHRSSRIDIQDLSIFGKFANMLHQASTLNFGIYLFHYLG